MNIVDLLFPWLVGGSVGMALFGAAVVLVLMLLELTQLPAPVMPAIRYAAPLAPAPMRPRPAAPGRPSAAWQSLALLPS